MFLLSRKFLQNLDADAPIADAGGSSCAEIDRKVTIAGPT
jgi:hypothetical protein